MNESPCFPVCFHALPMGNKQENKTSSVKMMKVEVMSPVLFLVNPRHYPAWGVPPGCPRFLKVQPGGTTHALLVILYLIQTRGRRECGNRVSVAVIGDANGRHAVLPNCATRASSAVIGGASGRHAVLPNCATRASVAVIGDASGRMVTFAAIVVEGRRA